ncbi:MAG: hypothetical protein MAG715_00089 [Methanonatronarchaeales archaeon]|nr:hypothetical protein [Methanonatronarchaeales archaeon]
MQRIGFLVNPVAGMGGRVGLKGTDGLVEEARSRGAEPLAGKRALRGFREHGGTFRGTVFLTCGGEMGVEVLEEAGVEYEVVYEPGEPTTAGDTLEACGEFLRRGVDVVLFCGGDGTARDVHSVVEGEVPILGIPAGVKMQSGVFATSPARSWEVADDFFAHGAVREAEVVDVDEEAYRAGRLETRIYGVALTPDEPHIQGSKSVYVGGSEEEDKGRIARFLAEVMQEGRFVLGPGSTTAAIAEELGQEGTLLGVDLYEDGELVASDLPEERLLELVDSETRVVVSPIGAQGFLFGRGNQQISAKVLRAVRPENVIVVATPQKMRGVDGLLVDTGDPDVDRELEGERRVVVGYRLAQRVGVCRA